MPTIRVETVIGPFTPSPGIVVAAVATATAAAPFPALSIGAPRAQATAAAGVPEVTTGGFAHGDQITRDNVGVPAGTSLTTVAGDVELSTNGETYTGKLVQGTILVRATNVTIRNCRVRSGINSYYAGVDYNPTIEDCDIGAADDGTAPTSHRGDDGIRFSSWTARRCVIEGFSDGAKINGGCTLEDSWVRVHFVSGDHNDGVQNNGGSGAVVVRRCNIDARPTNNSSESGNAAIFSADGVSGTTTFTKNLVAGGGYTVRLHENGTYIVTDNKLVRGSYQFGTHSLVGGTISQWSGNTFSDNGQVINQ